MSVNVSRGVASATAWQLIALSGIVVGLLLTALAPLLPERVEGPGLYGGIGLSLACTGVLVAYLARGTQLEWKGVSPAVGVLIGALPLVVLLGWHHSADTRVLRATGESPNSRGGTGSARTPAWISQLPVPRPQAQQGSHSPGEQQHADPMLGEVSAVLAEKARPALRAASQAIAIALHAKDPHLMNSQFAAARAGFADLQASLERIRTENPSRADELDEVLGDTSPLTDLMAKFERYGEAAGAAEQTSEAESLDEVRDLRGYITDANRWLAGREQGIVAARTADATQ